MLVFLRFWQPRNLWRFAHDAATVERHSHTKAQVAKAWLPFLILTIFVLLWGLPAIKGALNRATTPAFAVTLPDGKPRPGPPGWDGAGGGLAARVGAAAIAAIVRRHAQAHAFAVLAIVSMLGLGFVTRYSGMDAVLGLAFTRTGWLFPFFGTLLGWLGSAACNASRRNSCTLIPC